MCLSTILLQKNFLIFSITIVYNNKKKSFKNFWVQNYHDLSNLHSNFHFYFL